MRSRKALNLDIKKAFLIALKKINRFYLFEIRKSFIPLHILSHPLNKNIWTPLNSDTWKAIQNKSRY